MNSFKRRGLMAAVLAATMIVGACSDDPVGPDEHAEAEGLLLRLNGVTVASYDEGSWTGQLEVTVGMETAHIDVVFVDHDGTAIATDDEVYLEVVVASEAIAEFEQDTPGEFGGHLHGVAVGETTAVFRLMHGAVGSGHADFETSGVTVRVNP
jgi:hypothetical protein